MKTIWLVSSVFDIIPLFSLNTTYDHEPFILQNRFLQNKAKNWMTLDWHHYAGPIKNSNNNNKTKQKSFINIIIFLNHHHQCTTITNNILQIHKPYRYKFIHNTTNIGKTWHNLTCI